MGVKSETGRHGQGLLETETESHDTKPLPEEAQVWLPDSATTSGALQPCADGTTGRGGLSH